MVKIDKNKNKAQLCPYKTRKRKILMNDYGVISRVNC